MIGVQPEFQGQGLARVLLKRVEQLASESDGLEGVTLTTDDRGNVEFQKRMGYELVGYVQIASELESWGFSRPK